MSYNGWTNYETWAVALWVDNDEGSYHARREIVQAHDKDDLEGGRIAESLKAWVGEWCTIEGASLASDLLSSALSEVNWQELAEAWWEEEDHEDEDSEEPEEDEDNDSLPLEA